MNLSAENEASSSCDFRDNLCVLRQIPFFSGIPLEVLKVFAYLCTREAFNPGDYLFCQDDDDGQAFYIVSGKVRLVRKDEGGELVIRDYDKGEFLGGLALVGKMRRLFSLQALTDTTCLVMTRGKFTKVMDRFPELMPKVLQAVVESIRAWEERFFLDHVETCDACRQKAGVLV